MEALEALAELRAGLLELLSLLDGAEPVPPAVLERGRKVSDDAFRRLRDLLEEHGSVAPELRAGLEDVQRLGAVVALRTAERRDQTAHELEALRGARQRIAALASGRPTSRSCDVSG